jgi:hypothetical protein
VYKYVMIVMNGHCVFAVSVTISFIFLCISCHSACLLCQSHCDLLLFLSALDHSFN